MFDRYYCINSANHCENEENIGALYFITSSHYRDQACFSVHLHSLGSEGGVENRGHALTIIP